MSIPEYFAGNPLKYPVTRDSVDQALTSIVYIHGGWITVESTASLLDIDVSKVATGQIAYVSESRQFYIAKFYPVDWSSPTGPFEDTVEWSEFAFSGSFQGDGSQLTGIASSLYLSGSTGSDTVNLKTDALTLTGSAGGIIVTVTDNKATFTIASPATISGSFTGDGSGLSGVGGVPGGTVNQIQYNSASAFGGAEIYYSSSGNLGIGVTNPSVKLHVDGNAIITGTLTAQEFHTEFVSASIIYQSGSTKFGDSADDLHSFTGSVNITGSITALAYSGSFSGSFQGDGSNLTGIASTLALSGSTGNDLVNLKTEALTLTGSARNIDVAVTNNTATATVANNLQLSDVELTGSFKGAFEGTFSGSVDAVITNAITASYVLNAISASYALTSSYALTATSASHALQSNNAITASYSLTAGNAISASYSTTASYVPGYVRDSGGQVDEVAIWSSTDQISGSQGFFVSRSFGGNVATFLDGYYYSQNNGAFVALSSADASGSRTTMGMYNPGTGTAIIYAGSGSGVTTGAIKIATDILDQAYAIGTNISPNKANTLRIEPTVELLNGITGSFSGSFYGQFVGLIDSASYAVYAVNAATASYVLNAVSASYAATASSADSFRVRNTLIASGLTYPTADGLENQFIQTDGAGTLSFNDVHTMIEDVFTGEAITKGDPLYISGSEGAKPIVYKADPTDPAKMPVMYIALETTGSAADTRGIILGLIEGVDTTGFATGTEIYVAPGGGWTSTRPTGSAIVQSLGYVTKEGSGGKGIVLNPGPFNLPNLVSGSVWMGNSSSVPAAIPTASLSVARAVSSSYATSASYTTYAASAATASFVSGYAQGTGDTNQVTIWKTANTVSGSNWLTVTSSFNATGIPAVLMNGNYYSYAQTATGGNGYVAFSGSAATTASLMGLNVSQNEGQLYSANAGVVKSAIRLSTIYTDAYTIGRFLTPGTDNLLRIAPDVEILGAVTASTFVGDLIGTASYATKAESVGILNQDVTIVGDLTVYGTSSFVSVTSSRLDVDYDFISVNVFEPAQRFGGLRVYDSGSESHQATASLAWDSTRNHWVYENVSGSTYSGGGLMSGPRNTGSLGDEPYPTLNTILRGQGGDHLYDANITDNDTVVSVKIPLEITGSVKATGNFSGSFIGDGSGLSGVAANPAGADKSVQFRSGSVTSGATAFFYDHVNARVGIGVTDPTAKLEIAGFSTGAGLKLNYGNSSGTIEAVNFIANGGANGVIGMQMVSAGVGDLWLGGSGGRSLTLYRDGNVGIGTATPNSKLHVHGTSYFFDQSIFSDKVGIGTTAPAVGLHVYNTTQGRIAIETSGSRRFDIIGDGDGLAFRDQTAAAIRMVVNTSGAVKLNTYGSGTNTGTATKSLAVDSSGNVIEIDVSSNGTGVANEVAFWKDTDTVSGSQDFTWDGTTLSINGVLEANEKSFVIEHPTQPGKKLVYGVLEGPEHAVYCRGKISGEVIELPEEWTGLVHEDSITVQLTSIGKHQNLYVVDIRDNKVFIKNGDLLTSKINAYYYIQATRKDTKPLQTVRDK